MDICYANAPRQWGECERDLIEVWQSGSVSLGCAKCQTILGSAWKAPAQHHDTPGEWRDSGALLRLVDLGR